jgi:PDZ domain
MKIPLFIALAACFTGCASDPFVQYYHDHTKQMSAPVRERLLPPERGPQIVATPFAKHLEEGQRLDERGYVLIGEANFRGGAPTQQQLLARAKAVGAEVVLFSAEFSHTEQGVAPVVSYQPGSTATTTQQGTVRANAFGSGGYAYGSGSYSGTATTTTQGTLQTQYVPYHHQIHNYGATFWKRLKMGVLGLSLGPIPDNKKAALERNTGAHVEAVTEGSPAFKANILRGDVLVQIADKNFATVEEFMAILPAYAGQKTVIKILRGSRTLDIEVQLNPQP